MAMFKLCHGDRHSMQILSLQKSPAEIPSIPNQHHYECSFTQFGSPLSLLENPHHLNIAIDNNSPVQIPTQNDYYQQAWLNYIQARAPPYRFHS